MGIPLYFVTVSHPLYGVIFGGHWFAHTPAEAKQLAREKYLEGQHTAKAHGLPPSPPLGGCEMRARRSVSYANAMNPEAA